MPKTPRPFEKDPPLAQFDALHQTCSAVYALLQRAAPEHRDCVINDVLGQLGSATDADRAYIFVVRDMLYMQNTDEWCATGITPHQNDLQELPHQIGAPFWQGFRSEGYFALSSVKTLPQGSELRQILLDQHIKSLLVVPLWHGQDITGFLGLDYVRKSHGFAKTEIQCLQGLAASIALFDRMAHQTRKQHKLQAELRTAQSRMAAMSSAMPQLAVEADQDGVITGFQQTDPLLFALVPDEVIGKRLEQVLPAELAQIARSAMTEVDEAGWSQTHNYSLTIDGQEKHFAAQSHALTALHRNDWRQYMMLVRDITESSRHAHLARQLGLVAELSTNLIILTDKDRNITWLNPQAIARSGYEKEQALETLPSDLFGLNQHDPDTANRICKTLDQGYSLREEVQVFDRNGLPYWVDLNIQALHDDMGIVQGYMFVGTEITSLKLAEARALAERATMMDASQEGIAIISAQGRFSYINGAMRKLLGVSVDVTKELVLWHDIMPEELVDRLQGIITILFTKGTWSGEFSIRPDGAEMRYFDLSVTVQDDGSLLAIMRDISARKAAIATQARLREQLQIAQSRQLVAQLAGGLAHDFSNILAIMNVSLLSLLKQVEPELRAEVERIQSAADQASGLVGKLMTTGRSDVQLMPVDLSQIARQAADLIRPSLPDDSAFDVTIPQNPIMVIGDTTALMQVLLNLLINARDANADCSGRVPSNGARCRITLAVDAQKDALSPDTLEFGRVEEGVDYAVIEVTDTGPGIAPHVRDHLFKPHITTKGRNGVGLGLAVTRDIVVASGGALQLESCPQKGACFRIFLPCPSKIETRKNDSAADSKPLADFTILLVDDDDSVLQHFARVLSDAGADVVSCDNPEDALEVVKDDPETWDAIVTDFQMPDMDGVEFACKLREFGGKTPIVLASSDPELHFATRSAHNSFSAVLRKPVGDFVLVSVLQSVVLRNTHA